MVQSAFPKMDPSEDGVYQIYSLCYGHLAQRRVHDNFMRRDMHDGPMPLDFNVWIVRNEHRTVLVDTGFSQRAADERRWQLLFDPVEAIGKLGIAPESVQDVFVTHLHFDHAGNIDRFPQARLHVQDAEVNFATGRCMCEPNLRAPFDVEDMVALVRRLYGGRVCFHDGDASPLPGITVHSVPGHTPGTQAVRVMTPRGPVLLASDSTHYFANVLRRSPFSSTVDAIATLRSYSRLMELAGTVDRLIPGHDPRIRALYPSVTLNGVELQLLHETPLPHDVAQLSQVP